MIDHDDSDFFLLIGWLTNGWVSVLALIVALGVGYAACQNDAECAKRMCPDGMKSKLMENSCMCITEAKPK